MKRKSYRQGFMLLEVVVAIAIIAALASIAVPRYASYLEKARAAACLANRETINKKIIVHMVAGNNPPESLSDAGYPNSLCPSGGIYVLVPAGKGREVPTVACSLHGDTPVPPHPPPPYPKKIPLTGFDGFIRAGSGWDLTDNGILVKGGAGGNRSGPSNRLFIPNPLGEGSYSIIASARLYEGTAGGYGIFFDTLVNEQGQISSGYILQFDRGWNSGTLIIRKWENNTELFGGLSGNEFGNRTIIPTQRQNPNWWTSPKEVRLDVTDQGNGNKRLSVYLDGTLTFNNWEFKGNSGKNNYTGFRGWGNSNTEFTGLTIDERR